MFSCTLTRKPIVLYKITGHGCQTLIDCSIIISIWWYKAKKTVSSIFLLKVLKKNSLGLLHIKCSPSMPFHFSLKFYRKLIMFFLRMQNKSEKQINKFIVNLYSVKRDIQQYAILSQNHWIFIEYPHHLAVWIYVSRKNVPNTSAVVGFYLWLVIILNKARRNTADAVV